MARRLARRRLISIINARYRRQACSAALLGSLQRGGVLPLSADAERIKHFKPSLSLLFSQSIKVPRSYSGSTPSHISGLDEPGSFVYTYAPRHTVQQPA
jgi:hypothetical protein